MAGALDFLTVKGPEPASYTPPTVNSDWAGNLVNDYQQGQQYGRLRQLQNLFKPGSPGADALARGDYGGMMQQLIQSGGAETAGQMLPALVGAQTSQMIMGGGQGNQLAGVGQQTQQAQPAQPTTGRNAIYNAFWGQESGNRDNVRDSGAGAIGPGQIMPKTWAAFAQPGENIRNPTDNREVSQRILDTYLNKYNGDVARTAVAYYSGPGNVAPVGSQTPWIRNIAPSKGGGPPVSGYVQQVLARVRTGGTQMAAATPGTRSDQLNPTDRAAVDAMYPKTAAATPAVQQPPGATGNPPFLPKTDTEGTAAAATIPPATTADASNNVATGPGGIVGPPRQPAPPPPAQVAQAQPTAPPQAAQQPTAQPGMASALLPGDSPTALANRQQVDAYRAQQANALMANPMTKAAGEGMMERAKEQMAITNAMQERLTKQQQMDYGVVTKGREEQATSDVKQYAALHQGLAGAGMTAANALQYSQQALSLVNDPQFYSGSMEGANLAVKRFLSGIGIDPGAAAPQEVFRKVMAANINQQINALRAESEAMGEKGGRIFAPMITQMEKAAQNPDNSVAANRYLTVFAIRNAQRTMAIADMADEYKKANGRLDEGFEKELRGWISKNPVLTQDEMKNPGSVGAPPAAPQAGPPPGAIKYLRDNPATRDHFDAKYGKGSAAQALGEGA